MIDKIINTLINKQDEIVDTLLQIEDKEVALEEIRLSHNALMNIKNYDTKANINSTYLPMNLPLYSLIIYVVIPKLCSNKSYYRPSTKTLKQSIQLHEILELDKYNIKLIDNNRKYFYDNYVTKSNVVIFVGKTENAIEVSKKLSKDIMFNSGQDCAKPNAILVNKEIYKQLKLNILKYIQYKLKNNGCIQDVNVLYDVSKFLIEENNNIELGGNIDFKNKIISPIITCKDLKIDKNIYKEFYAPIFKIYLFKDNDNLKQYFNEKQYREENMNICLFGTIVSIEELNNILKRNKLIEFNLNNSSKVFDSIFYTQIFTDRKIEMLGNTNNIYVSKYV